MNTVNKQAQRLMIQSSIVFLLMCCVTIGRLSAQIPLKLEEAYTLAEANYPLIKDVGLLEELSELNLKVLNRKRLPTLDLVGVGQVQSENISIGDGTPNSPINIDAPLETYRSYLDLNYQLFDGGITKAKKKLEASQLLVEQQALKVDLRQLKEQVNTLFLNILLLKQQKDLLQLSKNDIATNLKVLKAGFDSGTVLESEISKLKVRLIELQSEEIGIKGNIDAYLEVLSKLLGRQVSDITVLSLPESMFTVANGTPNNRPEQGLFDYRSDLLETQKDQIDANRLPKLSLFAQGGVGYPNPLNFSDISTASYGLGGLRLNWKVFDWGVAKKERAKIEVQKQQIAVDREVFEFNIQKQENEYLEKIDALSAQLGKDEEIVALQSEILQQSAIQLKEGVINSNDYLLQVNAELAARQQMELHRIQKQKLQIEYLTLYGKL